MRPLLDLYKDILRLGGCTVDDQGYVFLIVPPDRLQPADVNGKRLVLPTAEHQANPREKVLFHPGWETITRNESEVIHKLRDFFNTQINIVIGSVGLALLNLAASPAEHGKLTPEQTKVLIALKNADKTSFQNFTEVMMKGASVKVDRLFANIFLNRGGMIRGKKYARVGIISFPFYEELKKEGTNYYGVKIRAKDKEVYQRLYQYLFPAIDDPEAYNVGSDSQVAPWLDALVRATLELRLQLNEVVHRFKDFVDRPEELLFDDSWTEDFEHLDQYLQEIHKIPMQAGNEGYQVAPQAPQPAAQPAPAPQAPTLQHTDRGLDFHSVKSTFTQPFTPPQPALTQPATQPPAQLQHTGRGLDFHSVVAVNPAIMGAPNLLARPTMPYGYNYPPAEPPPSWAPNAYAGPWNAAMAWGAPQPGGFQQTAPYGFQPLGPGYRKPGF
jgi:hypothetical protein